MVRADVRHGVDRSLTRSGMPKRLGLRLKLGGEQTVRSYYVSHHTMPTINAMGIASMATLASHAAARPYFSSIYSITPFAKAKN